MAASSQNLQTEISDSLNPSYIYPRNYRNGAGINFLLQNKFIIEIKSKSRLSTEFFIENISGFRNLYSDLSILYIFETAKPQATKGIGNLSVVNMGNKFGIGASIKYRLTRK